MLNLVRNKLSGLLAVLAVLAVCCSGCAAEMCHLPDDCACAFSQCQLGSGLDDICNSLNNWDPCNSCGDGVACGTECGCRVSVTDDAVWLDEPVEECLGERCVKAGPPPVSYVPPMPPKFLPVPTCSVFSSGSVAYPHTVPGQVEVGYGPELAFPAGE